MSSATNGTHRAPRDGEFGTIEATNDKGIKLNGRWLNYSRYVDPDSSWPVVQVGDPVEAHITGDHWLKGLVKIEDGSDPFADEEAERAARRAKLAKDNETDFPEGSDPPRPPRQAAPVPAQSTPIGADRERQIARLTCIKAAAEIIAQGRLPVTALYDLADEMYSWALRG